MPLIRYEVTLGADAARFPAAFAPVPASTTAKVANSQAQGWTVTGRPGTKPIAAPYADIGVPSGPGSPLPGGAGGAVGGGSRYMPPQWAPNQYFARQELWGGIGGIMVYSDNAPPIPTSQAVGTTQVPGMMPRRLQQLRQRQVASSPNRPRFPRWGRHG